MPAVPEQVIDIPLFVERGKCGPMDIDDDVNSGFPFDKSFDHQSSDGAFRSKLDDIAKRHPEFAEHLQGIRSRTQNKSEDPEFLRRFERPFGSRFDRFGFPFEEEPSHSYTCKQPQRDNQERKTHQEDISSSENSTETSNSEPQQETKGKSKNIQQSNTADLGPKADAVNERNQRSMSAPPDNRNPRFVSSINIPIKTGAGEESSTNSRQQEMHQQPHHQQPHSGGITERVIPIHVEGRDEPVIPKDVTPNMSQREPQPERVFAHRPEPEVFTHRPEPERIFGQRPEHFTQFVREPRHFSSDREWGHPLFEKHGFPEDFVQRKQNIPQHHAPPQSQTHPSKPVSQQPQAKQEQPQQTPQHLPEQSQQSHTTQQPQTSKFLTPIDQIQNIQVDVLELIGRVEKFDGIKKDKQYLYLDEMLTRNLLKLDNIDTQGQDSVRSARKEAIKCIEKAISLLEAKAANPQAKEETMAVENTPDNVEDNNAQDQPLPMEVEISENGPCSNNEIVEQKPPEETVIVSEAADNATTVNNGESSTENPLNKDSVAEATNADVVAETTPKVGDTIQKFEEKGKDNAETPIENVKLGNEELREAKSDNAEAPSNENELQTFSEDKEEKKEKKKSKKKCAKK